VSSSIRLKIVRDLGGDEAYSGSMILWLLALVVMVCVGIVGYYQGAIRVACSFVGLLIAAPLAVALSGVMKAILRMAGIDHPVVLAIIAPIIVFVLLMAAVKAGALALHKRADTFYRYKASDTEQLLFERFQHRVGAAIAMANGFIYVVLLSIIFNIWGYFTFQLSTPDDNSTTVNIVNQLAKDIQSTKMAKAISGLVPAPAIYYQAVDILGDIYHNPDLKIRLASYPPFLGLAESSKFVELGNDKSFQELWTKKNPRPRLKAFRENESLQPILESTKVYTNILGLLNNDLTDLQTYLETGKSPKYDEEAFVGVWYYDLGATLKQARKPNMTPAEYIKVRDTLSAWTNSVITVFTDKRLSWKNTGGGRSSKPAQSGTWREDAAASYVLTLSDGKKDSDVAASLEQNRLLLQKDNQTLYFEH
jgi:hypothetical protein